MKFVRGVDPKESMGIGIKANALTFDTIYIVQKYGIFETGEPREELMEIKDAESIKAIIENIVSGKINNLEDFVFSHCGAYWDDFPDRFKCSGLNKFSDYRGRYLKYKSRPLDRDISHDSEYDEEDFNKEMIFLVPK
jgi:hypothetical protein